MKSVYPLKGRVQNYAWGGNNYIPELLGLNPNTKPYAEYWLGAHINGPSEVSVQEKHLSLAEFIASDPKGTLGSNIYEKFGRLPFLFKVLDVHDMLSIQVHPSKAAAEKGYKVENDKGIDIHAAFRNYKDDNHKPEIMVALCDFWLLHGFASKDEILKRLKERKELGFLIDIFLEGGYKGMYSYVMNLPSEKSNQILKPLLERIRPLFEAGKLSKTSPDYWAAKAISMSSREDEFDKGIFSIYFFNIVKVNTGEGIFQDAGVPHAYLEGQNMELMANSDNVLRGGLTPKHVDIPELMKHVVFEETIPEILQGEMVNGSLEKVFKSKAQDFQLSELDLQGNDQYTHEAQTVEIYILMDGDAEVHANESIIELKKGEAFMSVAGSGFQIKTKSIAKIYKAATPTAP